MSTQVEPLATTLPARYYTDPEIFRDELERFYCESWVCAGRGDQMRCARLQQGIRFPGATRQRDRNGAFPPRYLNRRETDAARRGRDEDRILRGQLRNVDQTGPSRR